MSDGLRAHLRNTRHRSAAIAGLLVTPLLSTPAQAAEVDLAASVGIGLSVTFGGGVPRGGLIVDFRMAQRFALERLADPSDCPGARQAGLGLFVQGTWMFGPWRVAAGLHVGGDLRRDEPNPSLLGELGWSYRPAYDDLPPLHGLHMGLLLAQVPTDLSLRVAVFPDAVRTHVDGTLSLGLRFPPPLGGELSCGVAGRPQRQDGHLVLPDAWAQTRHSGSCAAGLSWLEAARAEAASVPAFTALARELTSLGAPARLVRGARRAAHQEVTHAKACRSLASQMIDGRVGLGGVGEVRRRTNLATLVLESYRDGVLGEGAAAQRARFAAEARGVGDEVQRTNRLIARDEASHAELAWEVIGWALRTDPRLREVLAQELEQDHEVAADTREDDPHFGRPGTGHILDAHNEATGAARLKGRQLLG